MEKDNKKTAPTNSYELPIIGMTCANCAATIERTLTKKVPCVISAGAMANSSISFVLNSLRLSLSCI